MASKLYSFWKNYGFAVFITLVMFYARVLLDQAVGYQAPFMMFTVAVMIGGWYGGLKTALVSTVLSTLLAIYYFIPPKNSFLITEVADEVRLGIFLIIAGLISLFCEHLHKANRSLKQQAIMQAKRELQIKQSERLFRSVFNQQFQFMAVLSPEGIVREINDLPLYVANVSRDEIIGKVFWETSFWQNLKTMQEGWPRRLEQAAATDQPVLSEDNFQVADGSIRLAACSVKAVKNEGEVEFFIIQATDITARKAAEEGLKKSEELWRLAIQGMNDGIWDFQPGNDDIYFSPRYKEMLGYSDSELKNHFDSWAQLVHPEDYNYTQDQVKQYLTKQIPEFRVMFRMRHRNGSWRWILCRGIAVWNEEGKAIRFTGSNADMTELQLAIENAEAASRAKSEFLANMSHEIRTPMNAVIGLANLLQNYDLPREKQQDFINTLRLSAQSLMELITDLLDISKIENEQLELEQVPFNLAELIEDVISIMSVRAKEKKIELAVNYDSRLNTDFIGDPLRLRQIIMNLVSNAVKFTERGAVTVQVEASEKNYSQMTGITIDVMDTGIGIAPDKLETVFGKFSQADSSMTRKYGGTGLGLSISKTLAELMGGTITLVSTLGLGSKFTIDIPLRVIIRPNAQKKAEQDASITKPKSISDVNVLLVEDYKGNVIVATAMLENLGYHWELAENGHEAVAKVKEKAFDLVLMDVQMPGMDGLQATRLIRQFETESGRNLVPILAMTAYSMTGDRERCLEAGMNDYLSKPFKPDELRLKARDLLKRKKA